MRQRVFLGDRGETNVDSELTQLFEDILEYAHQAQVADDADMLASKAVWIDSMLLVDCFCCGRLHVWFAPREPDVNTWWRCPRQRTCDGYALKLVDELRGLSRRDQRIYRRYVGDASRH